MITGLDKQHGMLALALDDDLSQSARAIGCVLIDHYNIATGLCFPSINLMAAEAMLNERSVRRAIRRLKETGWIDWTKRGRSYHYTIIWSKVADSETLRKERIEANRNTGQSSVHYQGDAIADNSDPIPDKALSENTGQNCVHLTLEGNPRKIIEEGFNNFSGDANPSGSERIGESEIARQNGDGIEVESGLEAIRECQRKLTNLGYKNARDLVRGLPGDVMIAAKNAEMVNFGRGVGAAVITEWLETEEKKRMHCLRVRDFAQPHRERN